MPTFTERLGTIMEDGIDIWDRENPYPIFDETYRDALNSKIVDHYYNYEIGQETVGMFRHALNRKLREVMPFFNQLYKSQIEIDPLLTVNVTTTSDAEGTRTNAETITGSATNTSDGTSTENSNDTSDNNTVSNNAAKSRTVSSETPQMRLQGNEDYATSAADAISNSDVTTNAVGTSVGSKTDTSHGESVAATSGNTEGTGASTDKVTSKVIGTQGLAADLIIRYRESFVNIDMDVIATLEPLFMMVWDNGDEFTQGRNYRGFNGYGYWGI